MRTTIKAQQSWICLLRAIEICQDKKEKKQLEQQWFNIELQNEFRRQLVFYSGVSKEVFKEFFEAEARQ